MGPMATWFTADLHLGHANIIRYAHRPFAGVDAMHAELVARWNDSVGPDDTVWVLGDVALGQLALTLPLVGRLRGRKLLVAGNHDRCWAGRGDGARSWTGRYLEAGFDAVHQGTVDVEVEGTTVLAGHFPYAGDSHDADRYVEHRPVDGGGWLVHGHVHEQWRQRGRMINVGVDAWAFRPVGTPELAALVDAGPRDLAPLPLPPTGRARPAGRAGAGTGDSSPPA